MLLYLFDIYCQKTKMLTCKYRDDNKKVRKKVIFLLHQTHPKSRICSTVMPSSFSTFGLM